MGLCQGHKSYLDQFTYCKGGLSTYSMLYLLLPFLYTRSSDTVLNDESHCTDVMLANGDTKAVNRVIIPLWYKLEFIL